MSKFPLSINNSSGGDSTIGKIKTYLKACFTLLAIECYDKAIRLDPEDYDTWLNKGNSLVKLERYEEAIECYDKAIRLKFEEM